MGGYVQICMWSFMSFWTPKFALSQERINGLKRFFTCSYIFRQIKSYYNSYWMAVVKYGYDLVGYKTLKSTYQRWIGKLSWFFACWQRYYNFWLDHKSYTVSLTFKCCTSTAVLLLLFWNWRMLRKLNFHCIVGWMIIIKKQYK